ncbi:MAG: TolC family protein, partial [Candidatus Aureabacteria bacterium]|nr:TolC family protein [Candidatus Auribacterota bacterium]
MTVSPKTIILFLMLWFMALPVPARLHAQEESAPLTLASAIGMAYKSNKEIQIQEQEVRAAKANRLGAVSNVLPKVNVNGSYTRNDAVPDYGVAMASDPKKDIGLFTGYINDTLLGVSVAESLFNGGADI